MNADAVTVELFGIPRLRAGQAEVAVPPGSAAEVLAAVERACPGLTGLVQPGGRLAPQYLLSQDGQAFSPRPGPVDPRRRAAPSSVGRRRWMRTWRFYKIAPGFYRISLRQDLPPSKNRVPA